MCASQCSECAGSVDECTTCSGDRVSAPACNCPEGFEDGDNNECVEIPEVVSEDSEETFVEDIWTDNGDGTFSITENGLDGILEGDAASFEVGDWDITKP